MRKRYMILMIILIFAAVAAAQDDLPSVPALAETEPSPGDGATGPVIWLHPDNLALSTIIGTDDNRGLGVYDLTGASLQFISGQEINNADLRYQFPFGDEKITLIAAGIKDEPQVLLFTVDVATRELRQIGAMEIGIPHSGLCMYRSKVSGAFYVIVNSDDGDVEQYQITGDGGEITASLARSFSVGSETEGCEADDELGNLFIAEEETALWRYGAEPETGTARKLIDFVGGRISEQVEGVTLFLAAEGQGYLIASNEKNHSFLVYERGGDHAFVGEFRIGEGTGGDQVTEPNGIGVIGLPLGELFPHGLFIASDDRNTDPSGDNNFKLVSWGDIADVLGLLKSDASYDPRRALTINKNSVRTELETVAVNSGVDAADDPSIWIHPVDPSLSTIIGTDKTEGLVVYDLGGEILQKVLIGRVNNVDLRYNFPLDGGQVDVVVATNRTQNSLVIYQVNLETRELEDIAAREIVSDVEEVYGVCMYLSPFSGKTYAILNSSDTGEVEQYELLDNGAGRIDAQLVREFVVGSQTEGCVADDELGLLYIGEEGVGIWKYGAEPDSGEERAQVDSTGSEGNLTADVEGLTLYYGPDGSGYLIASSQGSSEFVIYERGGENAYLGSFVVVGANGIDGVSGTDGIDVTAFGLGGFFPNGLFVTQDDLNIDPVDNQNFKFVPWEKIAELFGLRIEPSMNPRELGAR